MKRDLFELASSLTRRGVSFIVATVVRRDGLSSAHQGDMALVTADGEFYGWIGGGCTRPTVEREAMRALRERSPRLISLSSRPERDDRPGLLTLPMTCQSGGTVEVYLDPIFAAPRLVLYGRSPIVTALSALAAAIGYRIDVVDPDARADEVPHAHRVFTDFAAPALIERDGAAVMAVVASMSEHDELAVVAALQLVPSYLGVVASRRRFALLRDALVERGIATEALASIANPAGLALGAREAGEVAVSILAQVVARRNGVAMVDEGNGLSAHCAPPELADPPAAIESAKPHATARPRSSLPISSPILSPALPPRATDSVAGANSSSDGGSAIDPVCLMTVAIADARHIGSWDDRSWYFCCSGCKTKFLANPQRYSSPSTPSTKDVAR